MPRARSPNRDKAFEIYKQHSGDIPLVEIAEQLNETDGTVRGWKSKDKWDSKLNGTFQSKNTERSEKNIKSNKKTKKVSTNLYNEKNDVPKLGTNKNSETNSIKKVGAPVGNKNAINNKGGIGAPIKNKYAVTTGEYESILFDDVFDDKELEIFNKPTDVYAELELELRYWNTREYRMLRRIKRLQETKGNMSVSSVTKLESETEGQFEGTTKSIETVAKNTSEEILKIEEALTRVQANKLKVIERIHKFDFDRTKLEIEQQRLEIYRNKQNGVVDIDDIMFDDFDEL